MWKHYLIPKREILIKIELGFMKINELVLL